MHLPAAFEELICPGSPASGASLRLILLGGGWLAFFAYWWLAAMRAKRSVRGTPWSQVVALRVAMVAAVVLLVRVPAMRAVLRHRPPLASAIAGLGLCAAGFAIAVWARAHLGRNWGVPMSLKEGHELVTSGPYRVVRHPIYLGFLLALLGSALVCGGGWLLVLVLAAVHFIYSAHAEDTLMERHFPEAYPAYKRRTKALIPFIF